MKKQIKLGLFISTLLASNLAADTNFASATITSTAFETTELDTTSSVELYTSEDIQKSNSSDIYEFLNEQTSIVSMPSSGNPFSQKLDLRGYGITDGYENIAIIVDGRKLNNIDLNPALLSSIPLNGIESIEILKGNGSVQYGDNAMAGVISITTKGQNKNSISGFYGSNNTKSGTVLLGYNSDDLIANGTIDHYATNGNRDITVAGKTDEKSNKNEKIDLKYFPTDSLDLTLNRSSTEQDIYYANGMTLSDFNTNPNGLGTATSWHTPTIYYSNSLINNDVLSMKVNYSIDMKNKIEFTTSKEKKTINNIEAWTSMFKYETKENDLRYKSNINDFQTIIFGVNKRDSYRNSSYGNDTTKDNFGTYISTKYKQKNITATIGFRSEKIDYTYDKHDNSISSNGSHDLNAYNIGMNYKVDDKSYFVNYSKSFHAPNVDRMFDMNGNFHGLLNPAISKTLNIGFNSIEKNNKLKITLFRSDLKNEIYYDGSNNTNIDKSYKYGLELFDKYKFNENYYSSLNYSYIIAKIEEEGSYDGNYLPGVSKHNVTLNLGVKYNRLSWILSHSHRSEAYNSEDFSNNASQKQKAYNSTNLSLNYKVTKDYELFAKVTNIFDYKNAMWVRDDHIFPVNFETTYYAGIKVKF